MKYKQCDLLLLTLKYSQRCEEDIFPLTLCLYSTEIYVHNHTTLYTHTNHFCSAWSIWGSSSERLTWLTMREAHAEPMAKGQVPGNGYQNWSSGGWWICTMHVADQFTWIYNYIIKSAFISKSNKLVPIIKSQQVNSNIRKTLNTLSRWKCNCNGLDHDECIQFLVYVVLR